MALKIVYIDDNEDLLEVFKYQFSCDQIEVTCYSDPNQAIADITKKCPDLLFIDYNLVTTTGDEVAKKLPQHLTKALITGQLNKDHSYKFDRVFEKPFAHSEVQDFINSIAVRLQMKSAS